MASIVVVGSLNMDLVAMTPRLPLAGETVTGVEFLSEPGGKGANQAYAAAMLGGQVRMLGRVGTDEYGVRMRSNLESAGCDVAGIKAVDGASGVALIFVAESGQNSIIVVPGANHRYLPADFRNDAPHLAGAKYVLLQLETPIETVKTAAEVARNHGAQVYLDPAPAPSVSIVSLFHTVDVVTPNETEAAQLVGRRPAPLTIDEARQIAGTLRTFGAKIVVMKLGEQGCLLASANQMTHIPAPKVTAVDATGAGDVFNAALSVACSEGATLSEGCRWAVQAAALSVTRAGAQRGMPDRREMINIP